MICRDELRTICSNVKGDERTKRKEEKTMRHKRGGTISHEKRRREHRGLGLDYGFCFASLSLSLFPCKIIHVPEFESEMHLAEGVGGNG